MQYEPAVDAVNKAMDSIERPTGQDIIFLKYKDGRYVRHFGQKQQLLIADIISKELFPTNKQRYSLIPTKVAHELWFSESEQSKEFKKLIVDGLDIFGREIISHGSYEKMFIAPDPQVCRKGDGRDDMFLYDKNRMTIPYDPCTPIGALKNAKLLDEKAQKVITQYIEGGMYEFDNVAPYAAWFDYEESSRKGFAILTKEHDDSCNIYHNAVALQLTKGSPELTETKFDKVVSYY